MIMRKRILLASVVLFSTLAATTFLVVVAESTPREVVIVARDMAFYLADDPSTANPTIVLKPGEDVRFVLRNEDVGMTHDLAIGAWGAGTKPLKGVGAASIDIRVPERPGRYQYFCTPHLRMMRGVIDVR